MIAGRMTERVKLQKPTAVVDKFGSKTITYTDQVTANCEVVWKNGSTSSEASELFANVRVEFLIRDAHTVDTGWRAIYGTTPYYVSAVEHNRVRGFKRLICDRINE